MVLKTFTLKLKTFLILLYSVFYMIYLLTRLENKKFQSRFPSWKIFLSLFLSLSLRVSFLLFLVHVLYLSLSHSISLSFSLFFDGALQLLLCGVMSSSQKQFKANISIHFVSYVQYFACPICPSDLFDFCLQKRDSIKQFTKNWFEAPLSSSLGNPAPIACPTPTPSPPPSHTLRSKPPPRPTYLMLPSLSPEANHSSAVLKQFAQL